MPVVTPSLASMDSVNAVPKLEVFSADIWPRRRWSRRSSVMARQTRPRPYLAMKLMASGVIFSAAMVRAPSFSRSSSSMTTTMRPARMSSSAVSTSQNGECVVMDGLVKILAGKRRSSESLFAVRSSPFARAGKKAARGGPSGNRVVYRVDSISNPQASRRGSGMYLEFLFLRAHSRRRVERMYWSGWSLNSFTTCSNSVIVGTTGPIGSGLPQLGLPRRFAIFALFPLSRFNYVDDVIGPNDAYSTRYLIGFAPLLQRFKGHNCPKVAGRRRDPNRSLETGYYTSFLPLDQRKMQILAVGAGKSAETGHDLRLSTVE